MNTSKGVLSSKVWNIIPWVMIFLSAIWWLWKARNKFVFKGQRIPSNTLISQVRDLANNLYSVLAKGRSTERSNGAASTSGVSKWERPLNGWVKLNSDASVMGINHLAYGWGSR